MAPIQHTPRSAPERSTIPFAYTLLLVVAALFLGSAPARAQAPAFEVSITPPDGTVMLVGSTNPILVTITNLPLFTNVTVTGTFGSLTNMVFLDDGIPPDATGNDAIFTRLLIPTVPMIGNRTLTVVVRGYDASIIPDPDPDPTNLVEILATNLVQYVIAQPPSNDQFTNAIKLARTGGWFTGQNRFASIEADEPYHGQIPGVGHSVWWTWTPTVTTNVVVDLAGTSFNPVLAVYRGTNLFTLQEIASAVRDGSSGLQPWVVFQAEAGATYRIAVAGITDGEVGDISGRVVYGGLPDTSPPTVVIDSPADGTLFSTDRINVTGIARDDAQDDTGVAGILLYQDGLLVATLTGTVWSAPITLLPGTNYIAAIAVDVAGNRSAPAEVFLRYLNPINDDFLAALELMGTSGTTNAINGRATREFGEPRHGGDEGGHSIWYFWRAPVNGSLLLTTKGSGFDTLLGLYSGDEIGALTLIAESDDFRDGVSYSEFTVDVIANTVYRVAVDGYAGATGSSKLAFAFTPAPDPTVYYRLSIGNLYGGTVAPAAGLYADGTVLQFQATPEVNYEFDHWTDGAAGTDNPLSLTITGDLTVSAVFRLVRFTETLEAGGFVALAPEPAGSSGWFISSTASTGRFGVRSGLISNGESSSLVIQTNTLAGTAAFDYAVSSEAGWDYLEFYLNNARLGRWSGDLDWQRFEFKVPAGMNRLEWRYSKDANFSDGSDAAFLDNFHLPLAEQPFPVLSIRTLPGAEVEISWQPLADRDYVTYASANLSTWTAISTNRSSGTPIQVVDPQAVSLPYRFYKVTLR